MRTRSRIDALVRDSAVMVLAVCALAAMHTPLRGGVPGAEEAIERTRAIERGNSARAAREYLLDLSWDYESLSADSSVLLELARLADGGDETLGVLDQVLATSRDAETLARARILKGDHFYATGLYMSASRHYKAAAKLAASLELTSTATLKEADALLAAGDASAAWEVYGIAANLAPTTDPVTLWAGLGLAQSVLEQGDAIGAAAGFEEIARSCDDQGIRAQALAGASRAHGAAGAVEDALRTLRELEQQSPGSMQAVLARDRVEALVSLETPAPQDSSITQALVAPQPGSGTQDSPAIGGSSGEAN